MQKKQLGQFLLDEDGSRVPISRCILELLEHDSEPRLVLLLVDIFKIISYYITYLTKILLFGPDLSNTILSVLSLFFQ